MKHRYLAIIGLCAVSTTAFANGYIGIGYGSTDVKADLTSVGGGNIDDSTTLTKFYGGYQFNKYVALEGGYYNLAQLSVGSVDTSAGVVSGSVDMKAMGISGVATAPLTKSFRAYVRAGAAVWDADITRNTTTVSADGTDALFGLGAAYSFTKTFSITADWELIDSPNPEFNTFSLGFKWDFK